MDDLISRQEAIDAINQYGSVWMEYTDDMSVDEIADRALKASEQSMIKILHDLPSAEPLTEEDYTELRDRFGEYVEFVVRDMITGRRKRWTKVKDGGD